MGDPWDDPRARAWARDVEARMMPAMRASHVVAPLWTGSVDVKLAVEVGAAVLMDKPLVLVVQTGVQVPDKLVRVADRILEVDTRRPPHEWQADLSRRLADVLDEIGAVDE